MPENQTGNFSLNFISLNASRIKKISVTPIYLNEEGLEVIGNVKDEYITPNICSNVCPTGAQCGVNGCGMSCGSGCSSGYLCLNYKCIKEQTSSGGGGGGSPGGSDDDTTTTCTDTCSSLVKQCGTHTICENSVNCGTCMNGYVCSFGLCIPNNTCISNCAGKNCGSDGCGGSCGACSTGYSCQINGTCIKDVVIGCGAVSCKSGEYCSNGACLLDVSGNTYFVATNGNDNNPGTFSQPWATWEKAFNSVSAGDIVYFRGGVYYTSVTQGNYNSLNGTVNSPILFYNYPNENPIIDGINRTSPSGGIAFYYAHNLKFKGLTIRNLPQLDYNYKGSGFYFYYSGNISLENCIAHNISARGFYFLEPEGNIYVEDCDSYNNIDYLSDIPGNHGDGFIVWDSPRDEQDLSARVVFKNCRAWNNADDGFDAQAEGYIELDNCWAFNNGLKQFNIGGFGVKLGSSEMNSSTLIRKVNNCIFANNKVYGLTTTDRQHPARPMNIYNNFAYNSGIADDGFDGYGFGILNPYSSDELKLRRVFRNNIAYKNEFQDVFANSVYTHDHNSWDSSVIITDDDFISLDVSQLMRPRKSDGSLPDITFGHLTQGSDLIDAGVDVGLPYSGSAPDLGPFESNYPVSGCDCQSGYYCSNGACLLNVPGNTYFVATNGNDAWSGNFTHPWATWGKAFTSPSPGDIVYFRGGVYPMTITNGNGYNSINDGTSGNPVYYWAYPTDFASGNVPILDCGSIIPSGDLNHGIYATADYAHFKGLTVRNVFQHDESDEAFAWRISGYNTTLELCTAYNVHGVGFRAGTNSTNMRFINCDAYNMIDYLDEAPLPGNDGYCFQVQNTQTTTGSVYFYGCRAWNCSDDGFTLFSRSYIEIDNCWSFSNGALQGAGNGWKLGFLPDGGTYAPLTRKITNSIGAYNRASGITSNDNNNEAVTMQLYNNLMYHSGYSSEYSGISPGFYLYNTIYPDSEELKRVLRNNLAHANEYGPVRIAEGALYTHDHNSWDIPLTPTNQDFVLLPENQEQGFALLTAPRKADGSLPDLGNYFKLKQGSDLIDAGTIIPGYHCSTSGSHPQENCVEWFGSAPDLGPFESNY